MKYIFLSIVLLFSCKQERVPGPVAVEIANPMSSSNILSYIVDPSSNDLRFFLKDESDKHLKNLGGLDSFLKSKNLELVFAMNGGMYNKDLSPQGLYIEDGKIIQAIDTAESGYGNFYLMPNGIFSIDKNKKASIKTTKEYKVDDQVNYATQSGPMLVINGALHPKINEGSTNVHIRNGVGLLPDGRLLFAMSKEKINFYDFASFFKDNACKNALYLDGFVSKTYLPSQDCVQMDGRLGVLIGQVK